MNLLSNEFKCSSCRPLRTRTLSEEVKERLKLALQKQRELLKIEFMSRPNKVCSKCFEEKPKKEFNRDKVTLDGLDRNCKTCTRRSYQQWYKKAYRPSGDEML